MALFDSGTPLANVALSDTFNTWRVRTNQINTQAAGLASNNTFTGTLNTFNNTAAFGGPVTAPIVTANTVNGTTANFTTLQADAIDFDGDLTVDSVAANSITSKTGGFAGPVTAPIVTANTVNATAANFTTLQADAIDFDGDLTVDNVNANNVSSKTGTFDGPVTAPRVTANTIAGGAVTGTTGGFAGTVTAPVVTANAVTATASANLGAIGNVTITGGSTGQYLCTDGAGNLGFETVAAGGYSICATAFCSCANPVLDLAQGNYFKIRATSNTTIGITGSGDALTIDYVANEFGYVSLPDSFNWTSDDPTINKQSGNTISQFVMNNQYRMEFNKVGSEWFGKICHIKYHPSCETRRQAPAKYFRCFRMCYPYGGEECTFSIPPNTAFNNQTTSSASTHEYSHSYWHSNTTQGNKIYEICGYHPGTMRYLHFCYNGKPYAIGPSRQNFDASEQWFTCGTGAVAEYYHYDYRMLVHGYECRGFRCLHQVIGGHNLTNSGCCKCIRPLACLTCAGKYGALAWCCRSRSDITGPSCGCVGLFRPIGVWPSQNTLLTAELYTGFNNCDTWRFSFNCLKLDCLINEGVYATHEHGSGVCGITWNGGSTEHCSNCTHVPWMSLNVTPNYDFDKCTDIPLLLTYYDYTSVLCYACIKLQKIYKNPQFAASPTCGKRLDCANKGDMFSSCITTYSLYAGGCCFCYAYGNNCENHNICCARSGMAILANNERIFVWGQEYSGTFGCYINCVHIIRDACWDNFCTFSLSCYAVTGGSNFTKKYCGSAGPIPRWYFDCKGCHFIHMPCRYDNCTNSFDFVKILSLKTDGTGYVHSYCCCICTDPGGVSNPYICCNVWPPGGRWRDCIHPLVEIDIQKQCIRGAGYKADAATDPTSLANQCDKGMIYDQATCTWSGSTQDWCSNCGANTAPNLLYHYNCDPTFTCCTCCASLYNKGSGFGSNHWVKDKHGAFANLWGIHPLSNTELYSIN